MQFKLTTFFIILVLGFLNPVVSTSTNVSNIVLNNPSKIEKQKARMAFKLQKLEARKDRGERKTFGEKLATFFWILAAIALVVLFVLGFNWIIKQTTGKSWFDAGGDFLKSLTWGGIGGVALLALLVLGSGGISSDTNADKQKRINSDLEKMQKADAERRKAEEKRKDSIRKAGGKVDN